LRKRANLGVSEFPGDLVVLVALPRRDRLAHGFSSCCPSAKRTSGCLVVGDHRNREIDDAEPVNGYTTPLQTCCSRIDRRRTQAAVVEENS
jgi:hypothetical protein